MFEYEDGLLIVDELIYDPSLPNAHVFKINDSYYMINNAETANRPIKEASIRPYKKHVSKGWRRMTYNHEFYFAGMMPRGGFNVDLGRPITAEEFKELCEKYHLSDDTISKEFEDRIGDLYGKYAKDIKSVQIKVPADEAIPLEAELKDKGIEAGNISGGRVNIRTDWGGYREGAGRKSTGRKLTRMYVTEEEEQKLRDYLEKLRK
jgi:hypothetical protein